MLNFRFYSKSFHDEYDSMPDTFSDHINADGVAVSSDGFNWYKIADYNLINDAESEYVQSTIKLDGYIEAHANLDYTDNFKIKFQQYDDANAPEDGIAIDHLIIQNSSSELLADAAIQATLLTETLVVSNLAEVLITVTNYGPHAVEHISLSNCFSNRLPPIDNLRGGPSIRLNKQSSFKINRFNQKHHQLSSLDLFRKQQESVQYPAHLTCSITPI